MKYPLIFLLFICPTILMGQEIPARNNSDSSDTGRIFFLGEKAFLLPEISINTSQFLDLFSATSQVNSFSRMLSQMNGWAFARRGFSTNNRAIVVNGLIWNEPEDQGIDFNGLSMFYKNARQSAGSGLSIGENINGRFTGWNNFNINPFNDQRRLQAGYTFSNGDYKHALMVNYHSGRLANNWAIDFSLSNKWAQEGYVPGTFFQKQGYLFSVTKAISSNQHLTFTAIGNAEHRAFSSPITREVKDLSGTAYYNPNWGFQSGEKRNPKTLQSFIPAFILNYEGKFSERSKVTVALSYQNGYESFGNLDWYQAPNPYADYYKNLPSYYFLQGGTLNESIGNDLSQQWQNEPKQVDWAYFYAANRMNAYATTEQNALYVLSANQHKINRWRAAISLSQKIKAHLHIHAGLQFVNDRSSYFQELKDLLGGAYFVNLNQFAPHSRTRQFDQLQFDLKKPDRKIVPGEKYHYDYLAQIQRGKLWLNVLFQEGAFDFWFAGDMNTTAYQRTGYYQNGIFPQESFGASGWKRFLTTQGKIGIRFKINRHNQLYASAATGNNAPCYDNTFFAAKIRNTVIGNLQNGQFRAIEISWQINHSNWQSRLSAFRSEMARQTNVLAFYHDGYQSFVHMVIQGIATRQSGIEYTLSIKPDHWLSIDVLGGWVQSFYTSRPKVSVFRDNDTMSIDEQKTVYWKNYIAVSGPQSIIGLRFNIHHQHWGFISLSGTWQNRSFVSLNPVRHTENAVYFQSNNKEQFQNIIAQEDLPAFYLLNLTTGKTIHFRKSRKKYLKKGQLSLLAGINNVLNNRDYALYGSEQLRFDMDSRNPDYFPNKYTYGYGRTYFISIQYSFE